MKDNKPTSTPVLENESRRKAVKTIVGGVTVLAAYNVMPAKWGTPIAEQIFLPAHAATSGSTLHDPCNVNFKNSTTNTMTVKDQTIVTNISPGNDIQLQIDQEQFLKILHLPIPHTVTVYRNDNPITTLAANTDYDITEQVQCGDSWELITTPG